jgi:hypothetical protein
LRVGTYSLKLEACSWLMERETGFEPATSYLEGRHSATELLPLV